MFTTILQVFSIDVFALLDLGSIFSVVAPLIAKMFDVLPDVLIEPFLITTPVGDFIMDRRLFRSCPIFLTN